MEGQITSTQENKSDGKDLSHPLVISSTLLSVHLKMYKKESLWAYLKIDQSNISHRIIYMPLYMMLHRKQKAVLDDISLR